MSRLLFVSLLSLCACADDQAIVGPFTGETHRFVIDSIELPMASIDARDTAKDLDGDGIEENQLASAIGSLTSYGDAQQHASEMFASGAIASSIEIRADDLTNDPTVGVTFYGRDGAPARVVGGSLVDGHFIPNQIHDTDSRLTGNALLLLPIFADVDAMELDAVTLELALAPNGDGYDIQIHGAVRPAQVLAKTHAAIEAQLLSHPEDHRSMWTLADKNLDGVIADEEMTGSLLESLLSSDVELRIDGTFEKVLAFGFRMHATPCASGTCIDTSVATCFDRVRNGDETDVDCGGSCSIACGGGRACSGDGDCQSRACAAGTCAAVSCTDGVKNGLEASLDCGGACETKCARNAVCGYDFDCASGNCTATTSTGTCQ
jgi:hypothetical protein